LVERLFAERFFYAGRRYERTVMDGAEAIILIAITLFFGAAFLVSAIRISHQILKEERQGAGSA
jgi:hypothetical protein